MLRPRWMGGSGRNDLMGPNSDGSRQHGMNPDSDEDDSDNL